MRGQRGAINLSSIMMLAIGMVFIAIGAFFIPIMLEGFEAGRNPSSGDLQTDTLNTTGSSANIGSVPLSETLWLHSVSSVTTITDNASGTVVADNYTEPNLYLTGLDNATHITAMNVTYAYDPSSHFTGLTSVIQVGPTILVLGFIVAGGIVGFMGLKGLSA